MEKILKDPKLRFMLMRHANGIISLLQSQNIDFEVLANTSAVKFAPPLPEGLYPSGEAVLFALHGYTLQSAFIEKHGALKFHAGFGKDNFESMVEIPLCDIIRISVGKAVLFVNFTMPPDVSEVEKSTNIFKSNPKNQDIFKK